MGWYVGEAVVGLAIDDHTGPNTIFELADLTNYVCAVVNNACRLQLCVDNADEARCFVRLVHDLGVRLTREMQRQVLFSDESRANSRS